MRKALLTTFAVGLLALAAACTPRQPVTVTETSSGLPGAEPGQTIAIVQSANADGPSTDYSAQLAERFVAAGYTVGPPDDADLFATLNYDVGPSRVETVEYEIPEYETVERVERVNGKVVTFYEDELIGYTTERYEDTVYPAYIEVRLHRSRPDGDGGKPVYEGRVHTEGTCGKMDFLIGPMLDALFENAPRSGETVHEHRIKVKGC